MLRTLVYLLLLAVLAFAFAWFAENPGEITLSWQSYDIRISLVVYIAAFVLLAALLFFVISFASGILGSPRRLKRHLRKRRKERGHTALRRGIFAVGAGDEATAARYAIEARRALSDEPLTMLLQAQSAQLSGDHRTAQRLFEAMSERPETKLLGLRGLFLEASREGQMEAARQYAARAVTLNPNVPWPVQALFDMQCRSRDWQGALETLATARNHRHVDRKAHDRRRAVLLTAQAQELEQTQAVRASELALEAHRLVPSFVPAAVIAGRVLAGQGNTNKAARVLARTWQYAPHPDLAISYAYARPGDSPHDRLARVKSLIVMAPDDYEARVALATAAVDARDWDEARDALQPLLSNNPTTRVCALMARIEGAEKRDAGRVREWLARAVRARRDATWMADGVTSNEWQPISPVSGKLDAFQWCVPSDQPRMAEGDPLFDEVNALSHELETVARQIRDASRSDEVRDDVAEAALSSEGAEPLTITMRAENGSAKAVSAAEESQEEILTVSSVNDADVPLEAKAEIAGEAKEVDAVVTIEGAASDMEVAASETVTTVQSEASGDTKGKSAEQSKVSPVVSAGKVEAEANKSEDEAAAKPPKRPQPEIFVPSRPPDDPGPEPTDFDEVSPAFSRYRSH